jgi:hypothetical protein
MGDLFKKVPVSVRISILTIAVLWVGMILSYAVIFQNRPVEIWGIRLDRSPETVSKTKMEAKEGVNRPSAPTQALPNETSKREPSKQVAQAAPPTVRTKQSAQEARDTAQPAISPADTPRKNELVEPKKTDTNSRQGLSLIPPPSAGLPTTKSAPPYIAKIYRAVLSIKKKVDEGNPHGIAEPADVSTFNQYLSILKNKSEIAEIKNMRIIVPENYTQMRDLKAALGGLLVALEVNYDGLSEF